MAAIRKRRNLSLLKEVLILMEALNTKPPPPSLLSPAKPQKLICSEMKAPVAMACPKLVKTMTRTKTPLKYQFCRDVNGISPLNFS